MLGSLAWTAGIREFGCNDPALAHYDQAGLFFLDPDMFLHQHQHQHKHYLNCSALSDAHRRALQAALLTVTVGKAVVIDSDFINDDDLQPFRDIARPITLVDASAATSTQSGKYRIVRRQRPIPN